MAMLFHKSEKTVLKILIINMDAKELEFNKN